MLFKVPAPPGPAPAFDGRTMVDDKKYLSSRCRCLSTTRFDLQVANKVLPSPLLIQVDAIVNWKCRNSAVRQVPSAVQIDELTIQNGGPSRNVNDDDCVTWSPSVWMNNWMILSCKPIASADLRRRPRLQFLDLMQGKWTVPCPALECDRSLFQVPFAVGCYYYYCFLAEAAILSHGPLGIRGEGRWGRGEPWTAWRSTIETGTRWNLQKKEKEHRTDW